MLLPTDRLATSLDTGARLGRATLRGLLVVKTGTGSAAADQDEYIKTCHDVGERGEPETSPRRGNHTRPPCATATEVASAVS